MATHLTICDSVIGRVCCCCRGDTKAWNVVEWFELQINQMAKELWILVLYLWTSLVVWWNMLVSWMFYLLSLLMHCGSHLTWSTVWLVLRPSDFTVSHENELIENIVSACAGPELYSLFLIILFIKSTCFKHHHKLGDISLPGTHQCPAIFTIYLFIFRKREAKLLQN